MRNTTSQNKYMYHILSMVLLCGTLSCSGSKDVSGRYIFSNCTISGADKTSRVPHGAVALHISRVGNDSYLVEYIGGRVSGTKVIGFLKGRSIRAIMGHVEIRYDFSEDYIELHLTKEEIDCVYVRIKNSDQ